MNKRLIPILILLAIVIIVVIGVWISLSLIAKPQSNTTLPPVTFPQSNTTTTSSSSGIISVQGKGSGTSLVVKDFIHNGQTIEDPHDPGTYVLASNSGYCVQGDNCPPNADSDFMITYQSQYNYFNILLLKEPLGTSRDEAEQFLINALGVSADQICSLNYSVGTIISINATYGGEELGFANCPNAVDLPD